MTKRLPEDDRLLRGRGNLDLPAAPYFTGRHLTPLGRERAGELLRSHPEWRVALTSPWSREGGGGPLIDL